MTRNALAEQMFSGLPRSADSVGGPAKVGSGPGPDFNCNAAKRCTDGAVPGPDFHRLIAPAFAGAFTRPPPSTIFS